MSLRHTSEELQSNTQIIQFWSILLWHLLYLFAFNSYGAEAEATCCLMNSMRSRRPRCADQCMGEKPCSNLSSHPFRSFWEKYHVEHQAGKAMCSKDQILPSPNWIRQCLSTGLWRQAFISHMHQHLSVEGIYMKYLFVFVHYITLLCTHTFRYTSHVMT